MKIRSYIPRFRRVPRWLLEGIFIVVSVVLGFAAAQYGEYRENRELADRVLTNLLAEVEHNLATIEPEIAVHRRWISDLYGWLETHPASGGTESASDVFIKTWPDFQPDKPEPPFPTPRRAAWDAAVSTGALRFVDYGVIAGLSEIYQFQEVLNDTGLPLGELTFFDPSMRTASLRQVGFGLEGIAYAETILVDLYKKHLPTLRAAAGR